MFDYDNESKEEKHIYGETVSATMNDISKLPDSIREIFTKYCDGTLEVATPEENQRARELFFSKKKSSTQLNSSYEDLENQNYNDDEHHSKR